MWLFGLTLVLLCYVFFTPYYEQLNTTSLYILCPFMCVLAFVQKPRLWPNRYFKWLIILYLWVAFTAVGAYDSEPAIRELHQILGCVLLTYIIAQWGQYQKAIPWLYIAL